MVLDYFKSKKESMKEAKEWVNENYDKIRQKYDIYIEK